MDDDDDLMYTIFSFSVTSSRADLRSRRTIPLDHHTQQDVQGDPHAQEDEGDDVTTRHEGVGGLGHRLEVSRDIVAIHDGEERLDRLPQVREGPGALPEQGHPQHGVGQVNHRGAHYEPQGLWQGVTERENEQIALREKPEVSDHVQQRP